MLRVPVSATEQEEVQVEVTRLLVEGYFALVRASLQDAVPKALMHFLVLRVQRGLQQHLIKSMYRRVAGCPFLWCRAALLPRIAPPSCSLAAALLRPVPLGALLSSSEAQQGVSCAAPGKRPSDCRDKAGVHGGGGCTCRVADCSEGWWGSHASTQGVHSQESCALL